MKFDMYAESLGFKLEGKVYVKDYNGFKIYLRDWQYMVLTIPSFYIPLNKQLDKATLKQMEVASFNNAVAKASLGNDGDTLIVTLADGKKTNPKTQEMIKAQMAGVTNALKKLGYGPMEVCPVCKENAEFIPFGDHYCPAHNECIDKYKEKLTDLANQDKGFKVKHLLSLGLALLGALIGIIPALMLAIFNHDYFSGLMGLIPILATLGFFLGMAPVKKSYKIVVGIIVMVLVLGLLGFAIPYMADANEKNITDYMFGSDGWVGFRKCAVGLLLSFGGFGGMKFISKFRHNYEKDLEAFE